MASISSQQTDSDSAATWKHKYEEQAAMVKALESAGKRQE